MTNITVFDLIFVIYGLAPAYIMYSLWEATSLRNFNRVKRVFDCLVIGFFGICIANTLLNYVDREALIMVPVTGYITMFTSFVSGLSMVVWERKQSQTQRRSTPELVRQTIMISCVLSLLCGAITVTFLILFYLARFTFACFL